MAPSSELESGAPSWAPDSARLACHLTDKGVYRLVIVRVGSQQPPEFIPGGEACRTSPVWSPDGRWIACGSREGAALRLFSPDGKDALTLPSPVPAALSGFLLAWSRDASTLYVASSVTETARLDAVDVRTGRSRKLADFGPDLDFSSWTGASLFGSLAPDGRSFATSVRTFKSDLWIPEGFPQPRPVWKRW